LDRKKPRVFPAGTFLAIALFAAATALAATALAACSFDYGDRSAIGGSDAPDVVMENVDYVRVRALEMQARFTAERAERFEDRNLMELRNFYFEQFGNRGELDSFGRADNASLHLDSMNIFMSGGVQLEVRAEDFAIETERLEWRDQQRVLMGGSEEEVRISRDDGTSFSGVGFRADARRRTWEFSGTAGGTYVHD